MTPFLTVMTSFYFRRTLNNEHRLDLLKPMIIHPHFLNCGYRQKLCPFLHSHPNCDGKRIAYGAHLGRMLSK